MFNLTRNFALLAMSGALLAGSSNLSSASNVSNAAVNSAAYDSTEQQEPTAANGPGPFSCPAEVLLIVATALNQATMTDAPVMDAQAPSIDDPDRMWFTDRLVFPDSGFIGRGSPINGAAPLCRALRLYHDFNTTHRK